MMYSNTKAFGKNHHENALMGAIRSLHPCYSRCKSRTVLSFPVSTDDLVMDHPGSGMAVHDHQPHTRYCTESREES